MRFSLVDGTHRCTISFHCSQAGRQAQAGTQTVARHVQDTLDRTGGQVEVSADFPAGVSIQVVEREYPPVARRERREAGVNPLADKVFRHLGDGWGKGMEHRIREFEGNRFRAGALARGTTPRDGQQPGTDFRRLTQCVQAAKGLQQSLLRHVLRQLPIAEQAACRHQHVRAVAQHQRIKRRRLPQHRPPHQLRIAVFLVPFHTLPLSCPPTRQHIVPCLYIQWYA